MNVTKITVGRVYNLGNYENQRYEITVELKEGESAATAMLGVEKILEALKPTNPGVKSRGELARALDNLLKVKNDLSLPLSEFKEKYYDYGFNTPQELYDRFEKQHAEAVAKRDAWEEKQKRARMLLDNLGGAAEYKDAKLSWEDDDYYDDNDF